MIRQLFIVPREGETVEEAFDRMYPDPKFMAYIFECKWTKSNGETDDKT